MKLPTIAYRTEPAIFTEHHQPVSGANRDQLLAKARAGEPVELHVSAVTFKQPDAPIPLPADQRDKANANFFRFAPEELPKLAESFAGRPLLRDHERGDIRARAGTIEASESYSDSEGTVSFHQELRVVKGWAVEGLLDGTIDTFSISADPAVGGWDGVKASMRCSICATSIFDLGCSHMPGDLVQRDDGDVIAEVIARDVVGAEVSAVAFPAVAGTGVTDIRAELSRARTKLKQKGQQMDDKLREALGLDAKAGADDAVASIKAMREQTEKLAADLAEARTQIAGDREALEAARDKLATIEAEAKAAAEAKTKLEVDALVERAYGEHRIAPVRDASGEQVESKIEAAIRKIATTDIAAATEYVDSLPRLGPVGAPAVATAPPPTDANQYGLTSQQLKLCAQMGVDPKSFREANPEGE